MMIILAIATFFTFLLFFAAMAIGVMYSNKPLQGSCGGLNRLGLKDSCVLCGRTPSTPALSNINNEPFYEVTTSNTRKEG